MSAPHPITTGLRRDVARLEADARIAASQGDERAALSRLLEADAVRAEIAIVESEYSEDDSHFIAAAFYAHARALLAEHAL